MVVLKAIIKKEFIQTMRDPRMRLVIFAMPIIQTLIFGVAITNDVKNLRVTYCDQDQSSLSMAIPDQLQAGGYFRIHRRTQDCEDAKKDLLRNRSNVVMIVGPDFQEKLNSKQNAPVQLLLDGSDGNTTTVAMGYLQRMLMEMNEGLQSIVLPVQLPVARPGQTEFRIRALYNPGLNSSHYMVPGVIIMILTVLTAILTAMGITKEKEVGTLEQLMVSPIRGMELMLGKTLPFAVLSMIDALIVTGIALWVFGVPLNGSALALLTMNVLYLFTMLGMGLFVSTISKTQQQALMTIFSILFPAIILSDFFFPLSTMPLPIQWLTMVNPMKYAMVSQREIFLKGSGFEELALEFGALVAFSILFPVLGAIRFRRSMSV